MNLTRLFGGLPAHVQALVSRQLDVFADVSASDDEVARIAGFLRHHPEQWMYLHEGHALRKKAEEGIKTLIPYLPEHAVILVHSHEKWCVVAFDDQIYPALFKSTVSATYLHKVIIGQPVRWLTGMRDDVAGILAEAKFVDGETVPQLADSGPLKQSGAGFKL